MRTSIYFTADRSKGIIHAFCRSRGCRYLSACVGVRGAARLGYCLPRSVCSWNITALIGTALWRCNWLSKRGKQDCSLVRGTWRLTFRKVNDKTAKRRGHQTAQAVIWLQIWHGSCFYFLFLCCRKQDWSYPLQYPYYSLTWSILCTRDTFQEDDWVPHVNGVIPASSAGCVAAFCCAGSVIITHLQRWKQDTHWELLKGVEHRAMVLNEASARDFTL